LKKRIEVIDLQNPESTCQIISDFPNSLEGSFGSLDYDGNPLVCGGKNEDNFSTGKLTFKNEVSFT
jgi:hypothetical protein